MRRLLLSTLLLLIPFSVFAQDQPGQVKYPAAVDSAASLVEVRDNATAILGSSLSASATSIIVASSGNSTATTNFPASGFLVVDGREVVSYTGKTANSFTGVLRGQQGTPALVHAAGVKIEMRVLAVAHNTLSQAIRTLEAKLGTGANTPSANKFFVGTGAGQSGWQALIGSMLGSGPADSGHFLNGNLEWSMPDVAAVTVREVDTNPSIQNLAVLEFQSAFVITNQGSGVARVDLGSVPLSKLPTFAANKALVSDSNGTLSAASLAAGQLDFLSGVSSNIQTQLNGKPTAAGVGGELQVRINASTLGAVTGSSSSGPDLTLVGVLSSQRFAAAPSANQSAFSVSSYSVTGGNTTPVIDVAGNWNTTAAPTAFRLNISDTASDSGAALMNLLTDSQSKFKVDKNGNVVISGNLTVTTCTGCQGSTAHNMLSGSHTDTETAAAVRGDLIIGQGASPVWKHKALGASGKLLGSDGTDADWHSLIGTSNQIDVTNGGGDLTISLPQDIATTSTPRFGRIGIGVAAAAATGIKIAGPALSTDANQTIAVIDASFSVTKNDANTRAFNGFLLKPTLNAGGSNTTTTLNVFAIDTVNTSLTGLAINLASFSFGGSSKFSVDSGGNGVFAGALTVVSCTGCTANHNLLSATHPDVTAGSVARGDLIVGKGASPKWERQAKGASGQFLGGDGTDTGWHSLAGTTNQVTISNASGDLTVSLPQDIHTGATPQFARLGVGGAADSVHILKVAGGTVTADTHIVDLTETWNNGAINFTGFKLNVTDSASGAGSLLADLQVGGTSKFKVDKDGNLTVVSCVGCTGSTAHNMLSSSHTDSTAATVVRGDLIVGKGASPKWERLNLGAAGGFVGSDGTDALWRTISGTTNQVSVSQSSGNLTFSTPQDIATTSTPRFAGLDLGTANLTDILGLNTSAPARFGLSHGATGSPVNSNVPTLSFIRYDANTNATGTLAPYFFATVMDDAGVKPATYNAFFFISSNDTSATNRDAVGLAGYSVALTGSTSRAIGAYFESTIQNNAAGQGAYVESLVSNSSGVDSPVPTTSLPAGFTIGLNVTGAGGKYNTIAFNIQGGGASAFRVGYNAVGDNIAPGGYAFDGGLMTRGLPFRIPNLASLSTAYYYAVDAAGNGNIALLGGNSADEAYVPRVLHVEAGSTVPLIVENPAAGAVNAVVQVRTGGSLKTSFGYLGSPAGSAFFNSAGSSPTLFIPDVASVVNYAKVSPAATGSPVKFEADGTDTNIGVTVKSKGSGPLLLDPSTGVLKLAGLSNGFLKTSAGDGSVIVDSSTYLTANQTITLSGDVSGSGATAITTTFGSDKTLTRPLANGLRVAYAVKAANYTATTSDSNIIVDASAGPVTITLYSASTTTGHLLHIKKVDSSGNAVTVARAGSDTIEGATSITLAAQWNAATIYSNGNATWYKYAANQ